MPAIVTASTLIPDSTAAFVRWVALIATFVLLFIAWGEVDRTNAAEYYGCLLIAGAGVSLVGRANDLITLFLALELLSIPTYILLYLPAKTKLNQEAAAKYFLLSVMSSAMMLFGFSYLYGLTGSTNLAVITDSLTKAHAESLNPMALLGTVLVVSAIGFRITAVPFHFYAPDVYEGGPAGVIAQLAFFPKLAGFISLARILGLLGPDVRNIPFNANTQLPLLLWIVAAMTMCLGNMLALLQDNVKRMLAYSGVAHGGYMLMGIIVASSIPDATGQPNIGGIDAILVYLVAYGMMTMGAFAVILYLSTPEHSVNSIDDLAGIGKSHPIPAAAMAVFLFSLIGLPLTAGFAGKLMLFLGAFSAPNTTPAMRNLYQVLVILAAINAAIGAYYYLRVVGVMYFRTPLRQSSRCGAIPTLLASIALAIGTVVFGVYPEPIAKAARKAAPVPAPQLPVAPPPKAVAER
jgi:NADH-quinone oxidoreductase subunit N